MSSRAYVCSCNAVLVEHTTLETLDLTGGRGVPAVARFFIPGLVPQLFMVSRLDLMMI